MTRCRSSCLTWSLVYYLLRGTCWRVMSAALCKSYPTSPASQPTIQDPGQVLILVYLVEATWWLVGIYSEPDYIRRRSPVQTRHPVLYTHFLPTYLVVQVSRKYISSRLCFTFNSRDRRTLKDSHWMYNNYMHDSFTKSPINPTQNHPGSGAGW